MKKRTLILLLLALLGVGGAGAIYYYERQIALLQQLTYQIISINISNATAQLLTVNLIVRIFSNSTLDAQVKGLYVDVYINGQRLGSVSSNQPFIIPAKGYSDAPIQVNISPSLLVGDLAGLAMNLTNTQDFIINLIGYVQIKEAFLNISVPFNYSTSLKQITS